MKNYAKPGRKKGRTAYRTPSSFRARKNVKTGRKKWNGSSIKSRGLL